MEGVKEAPQGRIATQFVVLGVAAIGLLTLAACGGDDSDGSVTTDVPVQAGASGAVVSVIGDDYSYDAPDTIAGGLTTLEFTNDGQEKHELHLLRLNEGTPQHQFQQTLHQEGLDVALRLGEEEGHVATIGPGQTAEATVDLPEGEYVLICQIESPDDGVAHALKGMAEPLTVTAVQ